MTLQELEMMTMRRMPMILDMIILRIHGTLEQELGKELV